MSDVVERCKRRAADMARAAREAKTWGLGIPQSFRSEAADWKDAAAEIARLRAEVATLRADLAMARQREGATGLDYRGG